MQGLLSGDIQVDMQVMVTEQKSAWNDAINRGEAVSLGKSRVDHWKSAFVVPTYVVERNPGLKTVQDIRSFKDVFPQDGGKVILWTCLSAWSCSKTNKAQIEAYGLNDIIVLKEPGSRLDLFNSHWNAEGRGEPWLGFLWSPSQGSVGQSVTLLEEPPCLDGAEPESGCSHPAELTRIVAHPGLEDSSSEIVEFLKKWDFGPATEMAAHTRLAELGATFQDTAIWWLRDQEDVWTQWVAPEVARKVLDALSKETPELAEVDEPAICPSNSGEDNSFRAVHAVGNWGMTERIEWGVDPVPEDYFRFLQRINANWVGISVALNIEGSLDSTVERIYEGFISTFTDDALTIMIDALHQHGCNVYLTLAFETNGADDAEHPVKRWQLGDPNMAREDAKILPENWPWGLDHPDHERFVAEFWQTYTDQAVHFSELAEATGVEMFSLGTETERLFRTRSGGSWPNDFEAELTAMVSSVRSVYSGLLTYYMHYNALTAADFYGPGSDHLWGDLGLDVVGVSAYFQLVDTRPTTVLSVEELEVSWERIFADYLVPLKERNLNLEVLFLEFGYIDAVAAPYQGGALAWSPRVFTDDNGNRLDDNQEVQGNILRAFSNVDERHDRLVAGTFLWGHSWASDRDWAAGTGQSHHMSVRDKFAEDVVRRYYRLVSE